MYCKSKYLSTFVYVFYIYNVYKILYIMFKLLKHAVNLKNVNVLLGEEVWGSYF